MAQDPSPLLSQRSDPATDWRLLRLGTIDEAGTTASFRITEELLKTHLAIFGGTRSGKSKLFELICRHLVSMGRGFAFIDPHSDTADDLFAFLASEYPRLGFLRRSIHYLNPSERLFSFDPFAYHADPDDAAGDSDQSYQSWLHTKIKDMVGIIIRQQGETEDEAQRMVRLRRWMYNALYAVGVRQDATGTHLPLKDAFPLLNPGHPRHEELFHLVEPHLSEEVRADFVKLRRTRDPRKQEDWVESTFNRLRDILSPIVERIFNMEAPSIDFHDIIRRNGVILAALGKTTRFHQDEALAVAGLLIRQINEAVRTVRREERRQWFLFIDEAHNFLGDDLLRMLKESGKFKLSLGLAVQGLDNLQKGDMDLVPAVLGQCGIRITFRQQYHQHAEELAKSLCYPMLDFSELFHEADRHDGYDWYLTPSESFGTGDTESIQYSRSQSKSTAVGHTHGESHSNESSTSQTKNRSVGIGTSSQWQRSRGKSQTDGESHGESRQHTEGQSHGHSQTSGHGASNSSTRSNSHGSGHSLGESRTEYGQGRESIGHSKGASTQSSSGSATGQSSSNYNGVSESAGWAASDSSGESHSASSSEGTNRQRSIGGGKSQNFSVGDAESHGSSEGRGHSRSKTKTDTLGTSDSTTTGQAQSNSHSVTLQLSPLQKIRVEQQHTGRLKRSVSDQFAVFAAQISSLPQQHCLVAVAAFNRACVLRVGDVIDPFQAKFASAEWRKRMIEALKEHVFSMHPYYIAPSGSNETRVEVSPRPRAEHGGTPHTLPSDPFFPHASNGSSAIGKP